MVCELLSSVNQLHVWDIVVILFFLIPNFQMPRVVVTVRSCFGTDIITFLAPFQVLNPFLIQIVKECASHLLISLFY